jgi:hypothetical protein
MKKIAVILSAITLLITIQSCTEDINLNIVGDSGKIVIEGNIENGKYAEVILTRNSPVSKQLDFNSILVTNAQVYVSDGLTTDTLVLAIDSVSSIPLAYKGNSVIGVVGKTYYLTVIADGKTYTANTVIPTPVKLDSVWWKPEPDEGDSAGYAWAHLTEPAGYGNAYRWFAKRPTRDRRYIAPFGASFDDKFIDGKSFEFYSLRGTDPTANTEDPSELARLFKKTDTIYIKFCSTDVPVFRFYYSYETALQSNGNPFASPTNVRTNISGGGLGVWAGFGASYDTIYPKP